MVHPDTTDEGGVQEINRTSNNLRIEAKIAAMKARDSLERLVKSFHPGDFAINKFKNVVWIIEVIPERHSVSCRSLYKPSDGQTDNVSNSVGEMNMHELTKVSREELKKRGYIVPEGQLPESDSEED